MIAEVEIAPAKGCPRMDAEEAALWDALRSPKNSRTRLKARNALVVRYRPFVEKIAGIMCRRIPAGSILDESDLVSEGMIALAHHIEKFDHSRGVKFGSFCGHRIRGAILDALREVDFLPRKARQQAKKSENAEDSDPCVLHRNKPVAMPVPAFKSLAGVVFEGDSRDTRNEDILTDPNARADRDKIGRAEQVDRFLSVLSKDERFLMRLVYGQSLQMRLAGKAIGMSESRVSQLLDGARRKLEAARQRASDAMKPGLGVEARRAIILSLRPAELAMLEEMGGEIPSDLRRSVRRTPHAPAKNSSGDKWSRTIADLRRRLRLTAA